MSIRMGQAATLQNQGPGSQLSAGGGLGGDTGRTTPRSLDRPLGYHREGTATLRVRAQAEAPREGVPERGLRPPVRYHSGWLGLAGVMLSRRSPHYTDPAFHPAETPLQATGPTHHTDFSQPLPSVLGDRHGSSYHFP